MSQMREIEVIIRQSKVAMFTVTVKPLPPKNRKELREALGIFVDAFCRRLDKKKERPT
jgi:hypothetical protein